MKVAVLIMGTHGQPSERNTDAFIETVIKYQNEISSTLKHSYDFYVYRSTGTRIDGESNAVLIKNDRCPNLWDIEINEQEGVYRTFEKTYYALGCISRYDMYVRINTSMFINIDLLDSVINQMDKKNVYCNAINAHLNANSPDWLNHIYPRGDMMIFGNYIKKFILDEGKKYLYCDTNLNNRPYIEHVDDCLIGACIKDGGGKQYCNHIQMIKYNYIPYFNLSDIKSVNDFAIGSRLKTVPPDKNYSGYSWEDNEYRKIDVDKFWWMKNHIDKIDKEQYRKVNINDLLADGEYSRPVACVNVFNVNISELRKFLIQ